MGECVGGMMLVGFEWFDWRSLILGTWAAYAHIVIQTLILERSERK